MYLASQPVFHPHLGTTAAPKHLPALRGLGRAGQAVCGSQANSGQ